MATKDPEFAFRTQLKQESKQLLKLIASRRQRQQEHGKHETHSGVQKAFLLYEGQQGHTLPGKTLSVDVYSKGLGVEIQNG